MDSSLALQKSVKRIKGASRAELLSIHTQYRAMGAAVLRKAIIERNRLDLLATEILGYQVLPFHLAMVRFQFLHKETLNLCFRGAGKTSLCTVAKVIHYLCLDRNIRILLASKTKSNAEGFLKEIKTHLETNKRLEETFGPFFDPARVGKWDNSEIDVVGRTRPGKESSITCVGVDSAVVSKHYDVIIGDDIVDEDNARTSHMREKTRQWYYKTLDPTLVPPDPARPWVAERHLLGTRYHFDDLYGHLIAKELKDSHQVIPALDELGRSPWPERFPPAWFEEKKKRAGHIIFASQYQCSTDEMKGEIFQYDGCQQIPASDFPRKEDLKIFMGIDLAIGAKEQNDQFAIVVIGCLGKVGQGPLSPLTVYVLDCFLGHLRFPQQEPKILEYLDKWQPIRTGIEANAYQAAQLQNIQEKRSRVEGIYTTTDKVTRAWKLASLFDDKKIFFKQGEHGPLIDQLVLFPNYKYDDGFDALDFAVQVARRRRRRERPGRAEPGVI